MARRQIQKLLIRNYVFLFNAGDWEGLRKLFTDTANIRDPAGWGGLDAAIAAWPDLHKNMMMRLELIDIVCEGDAAAALMMVNGRFVGSWRGLPGHTPTGARYELMAMEWFTFSGNRISRRWSACDTGLITRQVLGPLSHH